MPQSTLTIQRPELAIIGAGIAGLACARKLCAAGLSVTVFEQSTIVGGRLGTFETAPGIAVDGGAQYFTARDPAFIKVVDEWLTIGVCVPWNGRIVTLEGRESAASPAAMRYVGTPTMSALADQLAKESTIHCARRVNALQRDGQHWQLLDPQGQVLGAFSHVLLAVSADQAVPLAVASPWLTKALTAVAMQPCWAVAAVFELPVAAPFDAAFVQGSPLAWIARNNSKPGRPTAPETWVLHADSAWSEHKQTVPKAQIVSHLMHALRQAWPHAAWRPAASWAHFWPAARPAQPLPERALWDPTTGLGVCGDWCGGPRVEGAFLSGLALAEHVLAMPMTSPVADER